MGLLDWILGKDGGAARSREAAGQVSFQKLPEWVREKRSLSEQRVLAAAGEPLAQIGECLLDVTYQLEAIAEKDPPKSVPDRFLKIIVNSKPKYLKNMRELVAGASPGEIKNFEELSAYSKKLTQSLTDLAKLSIGEGRYLPAAYGDEMEKIQKKAKLIQDELARVNEAISSETELEKLNEIESRVTRIREIVGLAEEAGEKIAAGEKQLKELNGKRKRLEGEMGAVSGGAGMKELDGKKEMIGRKQEDIASVEGRVHASLRALDRALKRYRRKCPDELSKALEAVLEDPVDYFLRTPDEQTLKLLDALSVAVNSGDVDVKDAGKTADRIREAQKLLLPHLKEEYARTRSEFKSLTDEVSRHPAAEKLASLAREQSLLAADGETTLKEKEGAISRKTALLAEKKEAKGALVKTLREEFGVELDFT